MDKEFSSVDKAELEVLLKIYGILKDEMNTRMKNIYQTGTLIGAGVSILFAYGIVYQKPQVFVVIPLALILGWTSVSIESYTSMSIGKYLSTAEEKINKILGRETINWELMWGGSLRGGGKFEWLVGALGLLVFMVIYFYSTFLGYSWLKKDYPAYSVFFLAFYFTIALLSFLIYYKSITYYKTNRVNRLE